MFLRLGLTSMTVGSLLGCGDPKLVPVTSNLEDPKGNFELWISNQSPAVDPVDIRASIDGIPVVQRYYKYGDGHLHYKLVLSLTPGEHKISARSVKGKAILEKTFQVDGKQQHGLLDYWFYPDGPGRTPRALSFDVESGRPGFM